jgi:hypothetical protein
MEMKLELVPIPVTEVDRAKTFYVEHLGFVEDLDVQPAAGVRGRAADASRLGLLNWHGHRIAGLRRDGTRHDQGLASGGVRHRAGTR